MKYIECPENYEKELNSPVSLFIAGGITGCTNWQNKFIELLKDEDVVLLNPRRKIFSENDPSISEQQILWEHVYLKSADATSFWFTPETLCPITLFELGKQLSLNKPLFVGIHPEYARKKDLEIQVKLIRPDIKIVYDLESLSSQVKNWLKQKI
jgi:hypothetical protein